MGLPPLQALTLGSAAYRAVYHFRTAPEEVRSACEALKSLHMTMEKESPSTRVRLICSGEHTMTIGTLISFCDRLQRVPH